MRMITIIDALHGWTKKTAASNGQVSEVVLGRNAVTLIPPA
jgi:hypothetical protein